MHCQQLPLSHWPNQRKLRNLVCMAELEDYLSSHTGTTHYFSKLFILLLFHSFFHDGNQPWAARLCTGLPELLGRSHRGNTFWIENFLKQGFLPNRICFLVQSLNWIIGLDSVDVLVDVVKKQVESRTASNFVSIFLLSWIQIDTTAVYLLLCCM
jgi:hypothetical protein